MKFYTRAGEDFLIKLDVPAAWDVLDDFANALWDYAEEFDVDEHVESLIPLRGKQGVPASISELVHDAENTKQLLKKLASRASDFADEMWD